LVINLYSTFSIDIFKCTLQASDLWVRSDISIYRHRLTTAISPLAISPSTLMNKMRPVLYALLFATSVWVLLRPKGLWTVKGCETGPTVYSPYPRRLESLTICGCNYKGSTFSSVILRPWVLTIICNLVTGPSWIQFSK